MIILLLLLVTITGTAQTTSEKMGKPYCNRALITRNCAFFEERASQHQIILKDGTSITNPLSKSITPNDSQSVNTVDYGPYGAISSSFNYENTLERQGQILDIIGDKLPSSLKMHLVTNSILLFSQDDNDPISLPWPPDSEKPKMQIKTIKEVKQELSKILGSGRLNKIKEIVKPDIENFKKQQKEQKEKEKLKAIADSQLQEQNKKIEQRTKTVESLFSEAKEQLIEIIRRGKSESKLTPEEKQLISKVEKITFNIDLESKSNTCSKDKQNAFYSPEKMSVTLCKGLLFTPNTDLIFILGHELAHSIDPCESAMPVYEVNPDRLKEYLSITKKMSSNDPDYLKLKTFASGSSSKYAAIDFELVLGNADVVNDLINNEIIHKIQDGVSADKFPFKKEISCLVNKLNITDVTPKDIKANKKYLDRRIKGLEFDKIAKKSVQNYEAMVIKYPQCMKLTTHESQLGEASSDMFGGLIREKKLNESIPKSEEEKVAAFSTFIQSSCPNYPRRMASPVSTQNSLERLSDSHPFDWERVEKILMNLPKMAEIYECKRKYPSCFDHLTLVKSRSNSNNQNTSTEEITK